MTREEAIKELLCLCDEMPSMECQGWKTALEMAIKALQEPVIDKIRAEIEQIAKDYDKFEDLRRVRGLWIAIEIIDKYKESEEKE